MLVAVCFEPAISERLAADFADAEPQRPSRPSWNLNGACRRGGRGDCAHTGKKLQHLTGKLVWDPKGKVFLLPILYALTLLHKFLDLLEQVRPYDSTGSVSHT